MNNNPNDVHRQNRKNPEELSKASSFGGILHDANGCRSDQALLTKPERRHRVQTCIVLGVPSTTTLTLRTLGC